MLSAVIHAGVEAQLHEDQDATTASLRAGEFYGETTGEKLDKEVVEACHEEMKYFEAFGCLQDGTV